MRDFLIAVGRAVIFARDQHQAGLFHVREYPLSLAAHLAAAEGSLSSHSGEHGNSASSGNTKNSENTSSNLRSSRHGLSSDPSSRTTADNTQLDNVIEDHSAAVTGREMVQSTVKGGWQAVSSSFWYGLGKVSKLAGGMFDDGVNGNGKNSRIKFEFIFLLFFSNIF